MRTWLVIAAETREFDGILKRAGQGSKLNWPVKFAREVNWKGDRWWLIANGPGPRAVEEALSSKQEVSGIVSTGFCGALDPARQIGDIVIWGEQPQASSKFAAGEIFSMDRVAATAAEKRKLRGTTGAIAVEMEAAAVKGKSSEWGVPFYCIRAVSDTANEDMPLDFNLYRDSNGRFSRTRIALAAMARPFTRIPALLKFEANCRAASESLGAFFEDCRF